MKKIYALIMAIIPAINNLFGWLKLKADSGNQATMQLVKEEKLEDKYEDKLSLQVYRYFIKYRGNPEKQAKVEKKILSIIEKLNGL